MSMIHVSCRENFDDSNDFSPSAFSIRGDLSGPSIHLPQVVDKIASSDRVLVLIHGYRNSVEGAAAAYEQVAAPMAAYYDHVIGWYWPGGGLVVSFPLAMKRANVAGQRLALFLAYLSIAGAVIDVETHSLGARVGLSALACGRPMRNVILTAPAVDHDALHPLKEFDSAVGMAQAIHILYSRRDDVLRKAYPLGDFDGHDRALGLDGPSRFELLDERVSVADCTAVVGEHGGYKASLSVLQYWTMVLEGGVPRQLIL